MLYNIVLVASKNVAKYNNLYLENFFISNEVNGEIKILDKENIPIKQPIELSGNPYFKANEGNKGNIIENPIPLKTFIKNKLFILFIFIKLISFIIMRRFLL